MMTGLSLRLRVFLFFCLLAAAGIAVTLLALSWSYARSATPELLNAFVFAAIVISFALLALCAGIWLLFDENVAKPIERISAEMRMRAANATNQDLDPQVARYLGDLAPAAAGLAGQLNESTINTAEAIAAETAKLMAEKAQLTALLSEIPVAMVLVNANHQIVLYDSQAAAVLAQIAHPRLNAALTDYIDAQALTAAYTTLCKTGQDVPCTLSAVDGSQSYAARLKPLGAAPGYLLIFDEATAQMAPEAERPLIYDFDLLNADATGAAEQCALNDLCFVVFDTETTGLLPHKDEIVQLGAVRVLRGRIVEGEVFETLVDPGRPIPAASTKVHGVSDAMVQGAPKIDVVGGQFHHFARDAVIVAHNAPFDMAFLHRHASSAGVRWTNPIVDTVLLSAIVFGASETHTLDALCDRLGVVIPEHLRHTALGDAQATAEVLVRMLPMLDARGFLTLGDLISEARKHGRLLEDLN